MNPIPRIKPVTEAVKTDKIVPAKSMKFEDWKMPSLSPVRDD